jgi:hypothetical protein
MEIGSWIDAVEVHLQVGGPCRGGGQQKGDQKNDSFANHGLLLLFGLNKAKRSAARTHCVADKAKTAAQGASCCPFSPVSGFDAEFNQKNTYTVNVAPGQ